MPGSAQISPLCEALKTKCTPFCLATLSITGVSLRLNSPSICSASCWTSCCASSVNRCKSRCWRSMFGLELCPRLIAQHAAALIELLLVALQRLVLLLQLARLLFLHHLDLLGGHSCLQPTPPPRPAR